MHCYEADEKLYASAYTHVKSDICAYTYVKSDICLICLGPRNAAHAKQNLFGRDWSRCWQQEAQGDRRACGAARHQGYERQRSSEIGRK